MGVTLGQAQREAVTAAVSGDFTVITGGPGTGKTTSINCILGVAGGPGHGRAVRADGARSQAHVRGYGSLPRAPFTGMLEYGGEAEGFKRDQDNPLKADTVVVDEMSMVDIFLMRALLRAVKPGARLILVGDADQLPSVGAGNVLQGSDRFRRGACSAAERNIPSGAAEPHHRQRAPN